MANFCAKNAFFFCDGVEDLHGKDSRAVLAVDDVGEGFALLGLGLVFRQVLAEVLLEDDPFNFPEFLKKLLHVCLTEAKPIRNRYPQNTH